MNDLFHFSETSKVPLCCRMVQDLDEYVYNYMHTIITFIHSLIFTLLSSSRGVVLATVYIFAMNLVFTISLQSCF